MNSSGTLGRFGPRPRRPTRHNSALHTLPLSLEKHFLRFRCNQTGLEAVDLRQSLTFDCVCFFFHLDSAHIQRYLTGIAARRETVYQIAGGGGDGDGEHSRGEMRGESNPLRSASPISISKHLHTDGRGAARLLLLLPGLSMQALDPRHHFVGKCTTVF